MATSIIKTQGGWASNKVTLSDADHIIIKGDNGTAILYWAFSSLSTSDTYLNLGTLPAGLRPITNYALIPIFSTATPYTSIVGSLWISHGGAVALYKPADVTGGYAYGMYMTGL